MYKAGDSFLKRIDMNFPAHACRAIDWSPAGFAVQERLRLNSTHITPRERPGESREPQVLWPPEAVTLCLAVADEARGEPNEQR